jgi:hypothetical protein
VTAVAPLHRLQLSGGVVLTVLGVAHVVLAFVQYDSPTLDALWFVGSGFFVLLAGGINVVAARAAGSETLGFGFWTVALLANCAGAILAGAFVWMTGARQPQGVVLLLLFLGCGVLVATRPLRGSSDST